MAALLSSTSAFEALNSYLLLVAEASDKLSDIDLTKLDPTNSTAMVGSLSITDTAKKTDYVFDDIALGVCKHLLHIY